MTDTVESTEVSWRQYVIERMRVLIVAGIPTGALLAGVGSRLAMLLLRLTSPDRVNGVTSDDGFTIGRVTLGGTYSLVLIGAAVGIIGAGAYRLVAPWLIGPLWFRRVTTGLAAGAVVGSMLIHSDGVDFTLLKPTWLAIGLFIALPALFGLVIGAVVDSVSRPGSWTARGRRRWLLPAVAVACFPPTLFAVGFVLVPVGFWALAREVDFQREIREVRGLVLAVRAIWLIIAVAGLAALLNDINALT